MESKSLYSKKQVLNAYFRLVHLISNNQNTLRATKTIAKLKLSQSKLLLYIYKKLLKFRLISNINSYLITLYSIIKRYILSVFPWNFTSLFSIHDLAFFTYHFLTVLQVIFLLKMMLDWFPVKNWDAASPFKRFLRWVTNIWSSKFDDYMPSFIGWIILINIAPIILLMVATYYTGYDVTCFPANYQNDHVLELILMTIF